MTYHNASIKNDGWTFSVVGGRGSVFVVVVPSEDWCRSISSFSVNAALNKPERRQNRLHPLPSCFLFRIVLFALCVWASGVLLVLIRNKKIFFSCIIWIVYLFLSLNWWCGLNLFISFLRICYKSNFFVAAPAWKCYAGIPRSLNRSRGTNNSPRGVYCPIFIFTPVCTI